MANTAIYLDTRRKNKKGNYPIKIRVTHNRKRKYYSTGFYAPTQEKFDDMFDKKSRGKNKKIKNSITKQQDKADSIIALMTVFSFSQFETRFKKDSNKYNENDVFSSMQSYSDELRSKDKISSSDSFLYAIKSFKKYLKKQKRTNLLFGDVTKIWLEKYEAWMLKENKSYSTIGIYLRNLRTVYNLSIREGVVPSEWSPFRNAQYSIPSSSELKRALTFEQINQIIFYECPIGSNMERSRDIFIFSYLCQGINMKDIAELRWNNLKDDRIEFVRKKTKETKKNNIKKIIIYLTDEIRYIINKWSNNRKKNDLNNYIFNIYTNNMDVEQKYKASKQACKLLNKWIAVIAQELNFNVIPTFYYARHSYSTILRNTGVDIGFISQALGHSNIKTTEKYLGSFEEDKIKEYNNRLIDRNFKDKIVKLEYKAS